MHLKKILLSITRISSTLLVLGILILALAIPNFDSPCRIGSYETAAFATLRNLFSAQCQVQATCQIDLNDNGVGEFAFFKELAGQGVRDIKGKPTNTMVSPSILSKSFARLEGPGFVRRSGYIFRIFLPKRDLSGIVEGETDYGANVDPDAAEKLWCCYAWPMAATSSWPWKRKVQPKRVFFVNQIGSVFYYENKDLKYLDMEKPPSWSAAFGSTAKGMSGELASKNMDNSQDGWVLLD